MDEHAEIVRVKHVIDCDADPFVPKNWTVADHIKGGAIEWDKDRISLHVSEGQKVELWEKSITGEGLWQELLGLRSEYLVLNANVLDYLLAHPGLIPKKWRDIQVHFFGTTYVNTDNEVCVRCLHFHNGRWDDYYNFRCLIHEFGKDHYTALYPV